MRAASEAETVVWDDDGEADDELDDPEADPDGEPDPEGDPEAEPDGEPDPEGDPEAEPDSEGDAVVRLGSLLGLVVAVLGLVVAVLGLVVAVEELEPEGDGVGVGVGEFVGVGLGVGVGVGLGEDVLEAGRTWHFVSVFALALALALGLVEVPGLGEAAASRSGLACAVPASTPRVRKPPPTTLRAATRTCARRIRIALSPLLIRVTVCSSWVRRRLGDGWVSILISGVGLVMRVRVLPITTRPLWRVGGPTMRCDDPRHRSVPCTAAKFVPSSRDAKRPAPQSARASCRPSAPCA